MIIDPNSYIDDYYILNHAQLSKSPQVKYSNLNFGRLTSDRKLVQIKLSIFIRDNLIIKEIIDWDLSDVKKDPEIFAKVFCKELKSIIDPDLFEFNVKNIRNEILNQLLEHVDKNTFFPRLRLIKKENEANTNNQLCMNCNTFIYNTEFCINCMYVFEKKIEKRQKNENSNQNNDKTEEQRQTERQKIIELRNKSSNITENVAVACTQEGKEKKICKKCGEVNNAIAIDCRICKFKFPSLNFFEIGMNSNYSIHFWEKIYKNNTIQQLKNFGQYFSSDDFCSLKYLFEKVLHVIDTEFEEILTEDALKELKCSLEKIYKQFSTANQSTDKVFDAAFYANFSRFRPRLKMMNFNNLVDIKEGWLPENIPDKKIEEPKKEEAKKVEGDFLIKRKRGRPKKIEIFKNDSFKQNDLQITLEDRSKIFKLGIYNSDMHYDFCGKCEEIGKLICCETCSSAYHYECLGYEKFPRGKFKCYFCKVIKHKIQDAVSIDESQMQLVQKLNEVVENWKIKAKDFLNVIFAHHCSILFRKPVPEDLTDYYDKIQNPRDFEMIREKLEEDKYKNLDEFRKDFDLVTRNCKSYNEQHSFLYEQAEILDNFTNHLANVEKVFIKIGNYNERIFDIIKN